MLTTNKPHIPYLSLLNAHTAKPTHTSLSASDVAGIHWSSEEKELFFMLLSRYGKSSILKISRELQTKGPLACSSYLAALQTHPVRVSFVDIPSAREMSDSWVRMEEKLAARLVNHQTDIGGHDSLLHTRMLQTLAKRVFMNRPYPTRPLRWFVRPKSRIQLDALSDLNGIVKSVTRKVVKQTIQVASSRINVTRDSSHLIRSRDVQIAVETLHLEGNAKEFWANISHRLGISLVDSLGGLVEEDQIAVKLSCKPPRWKSAIDPCQPFEGMATKSESEPPSSSDLSDSATSSDSNTDLVDRAKDYLHESSLWHKLGYKPKPLEIPKIIPKRSVGKSTAYMHTSKYSPWESLPRQQC